MKTIAVLCADSRKYANVFIMVFQGSAKEEFWFVGAEMLVVGPEDNGSGAYHPCTMG